MLKRNNRREQIRTGKKTGIWLALTIALGMHAMILLLPISRQMPPTEIGETLIELQLTAFSQPPPETPPSEPEPEPLPEIPPDPTKSLAETQPEVEPDVLEPPLLTSIRQTRDLARDLQTMDELEKSRLTDSILTRQFITEKPVTEKLFPRPLQQHSSGLQKDFHYPVRQSLITMLDQPMQELPFAYEPGLIHFAYDPGVKGDLQRFWDVITPEFGWRTKNGTEVRCIWVLVIGACAWK